MIEFNEKQNMLDQKALFNEIINLKTRIHSLAGFVQNDFDVMLKDGIVTKNDMKDSITHIDERYDNFIVELNTLREETKKLINKYV